MRRHIPMHIAILCRMQKATAGIEACSTKRCSDFEIVTSVEKAESPIDLGEICRGIHPTCKTPSKGQYHLWMRAPQG
jgi:hypothetical protein